MSETVLITGASSGIGKRAALYFAQQGWNVAATLRNPAQESDLRQLSTLKLYRLDVTDPLTIETALAEAIQDFGSIQVVVNNAGFGADGVFEAMTDDIIQKQFDTNVLGLMRVTRAIIPHMRANQGGTIIQISSMGGCITFPLYSIYHASKWAVEGFTESLQYELEPFQIRLKLIEPGAIKTEFYGRSRVFSMRDDLTMYQNYVDRINQVAQRVGGNGADPEGVARVIFQAATDRSRRLRYPVGSPAPALLMLRKILPDSLYFQLTKWLYQI